MKPFTEQDPRIRHRFQQHGHDAYSTSRGEFTAWLKSPIALWMRIAKAAGIKPE